MPKQDRAADTPQYPTQREKVDELTKKMEAGIQDFMQSEKYLTFLRTMSKFHNYSFRNCVLIAMQKPDATLVAGYQAWQQKFERQVERGAKGIKILAPSPYEVTVQKQKLDANGKPLFSSDGQPVMENVKEKRMSFRAVTVFDVSQTAGKPLPQIGAELDGSVTDYELLLQAIRDVSDAPITIEQIDSTAKGYYDRSDHTIHVKAGMSEAQTVKTALHELTHSVLHNADAEDADKKSRQTKECEAESVAFVVCDHFGLDTSDYSFPYLASWSSAAELPEIHESLATIQQTADDLISKISARFQELKAVQRQTDDLTPAQQKKVERNQTEDENFAAKLSDYLQGNLPIHEVIRVGTTPNCLRIIGADAIPVTMKQSVLENSLSSGKPRKEHTEGHDIPPEIMKKLPSALRNPIFVCNGSKPNTLAVITDVTDQDGNYLLVSLKLNAAGRRSVVNNITSIYGKKNIADYIQRELSNENILAMNIEKAEKLSADIGVQFPKWTDILCFDDSITYSTENVKRLSEISSTETGLPHAEHENADADISLSPEQIRAQAEQRVSAMTDEEKRAFMNAADAAQFGAAPSPIKMQMFELIAAEEHAAYEAKQQAKAQDQIIGNTPYREISDKTYVRVSKEALPAVLAGMEAQGIAYSGRHDRSTGGATITISKSDQEKVTQMLTDSSASSVGEQPQHTKAQIQLIGNTPYREIPDKSYVRLDAAVTAAVVKQLDTLNIPYSGKLDPVRGNIITVSREHKKLVQELAATAKETLSDQQPQTRYARCTRDQLEKLQAAGLQLDAQTKGEQVIIKFSASDADKVKRLLSDPTAAKRR